jgi:hypothetical protein
VGGALENYRFTCPDCGFGTDSHFTFHHHRLDNHPPAPTETTRNLLARTLTNWATFSAGVYFGTQNYLDVITWALILSFCFWADFGVTFLARRYTAKRRRA